MVKSSHHIHMHLDFYLVQEGLRPGTITELHLETDDNGKLLPKEKQKARAFYNKILRYEICTATYSQRLNESKMTVGFCGAHSKHELAQLLYSIGPATNHEYDHRLGLALGYPQDAVESFFHVIDGKLRIGSYVFDEIKKAIENKVDIPSWVAYLNHIPKMFDLVDQNISSSSKSQCISFMNHTRKNNKKLAILVEEDFNQELKRIVTQTQP